MPRTKFERKFGRTDSRSASRSRSGALRARHRRHSRRVGSEEVAGSEKMAYSATLLQRWLYLAAGLRLLSVYIGLFKVDKFRTNLFPLATNQGATLSSFVIAMLHFTSELLLFKTMTLTSALPTLIIAGVSTAWMSLGWGYYTQSSKTFVDKSE
eukprot:jgi/Pico_ML_1/55365/g1059.t1